MSDPGDVCVVGGGYTGLVAALRLAQAGRRVTLLEYGTVLGGLASGFTVEGAPLERAYHHLFRTDTDIIRLADELGVGENLKWHQSNTALFYGGTVYPFGSATSLLRFRPLKLRNRIRTGLIALYLQLVKKWRRFERVAAIDWMTRAVGAEATSVIWEPLLRGKFDRYANTVSMAWLWARIHIRANSKARGELTEKLGYFDGGFQVFTDALVNAARQAGVTIRTGVLIDRIDHDGDSVVLRLGDDTSERFAGCVATVPSGAFARLIEGSEGVEDAYLQKLRSVQYLGARLLIFSSDQDLSPYYWHNINDVELPFLVFINHTKLVGTDAYRGMNVYYIATYVPMDSELFTCDEAALEAAWFEALLTVFPQFDSERVREKHFFRFANAQHIVDTAYAERIPSHRTPVSGVYLANFSQIYPEDRGTNYAVRDGEAIAELLLADARLTSP